jgi:hypothetical protein
VTTADWALIISILSAATAFAGFVWNAWSKFIYPKPRVRVTFQFMHVIAAGERDNDVLSLSATNLGPTEVTLYLATVGTRKKYMRWRVTKFGLLNPLHNYPVEQDRSVGPFGGGLPKKLQVGEQFSVHFVANHEPLSKDNYDCIGFSDTFDRYHWAPLKQLRKTREHIRDHIKKHGAAPS